MAKTKRFEGGTRCQIKPSLEALEDRLVLSTATTSVPLDHLAGIAAATYAGVPFAGQIASFEAPSLTGLRATINWGDGHITAGTIAPLANQVDQVSGTNTFATPGNYSVIIMITGPQDTAGTVQTTVVVLPENQALALHGGTSSAFPLVIFADNVPTSVLIVQTAGTTVAQNLPVPTSYQPIYVQVQIYGPVRFSADQIAWERTQEHGLDGAANAAGQSPVPSDGNHLEVFGRGTGSALQLNVEVASQMTPFAGVTSPTPAAHAFAILLVFGDVTAGGGSPGAPFTVEAAPRTTDLTLEQAAPIGDTAAYQVPLFRVAERSELGNSCASTALTASPLHKNNRCTLTVMAPAVPPAQLESAGHCGSGAGYRAPCDSRRRWRLVGHHMFHSRGRDSVVAI